MDKSFLMFMAVGVGFLYFITNFIGGIQEKDDRFSNSEYNTKHKYDKYMSEDAIGQKILVVTDTDENTQIAAWQESPLKKEFFGLFPNYGEMKIFVKSRTRGKLLQKKLLGKIDEVESKFFSGTLSSEDAKRTLDILK